MRWSCPRSTRQNFRKREWRRILKRAQVGHRALKDLRDTYASQLLSCGVSLGYVSHQLGHQDVSTTAKHYARWIGAHFGDREHPDRLIVNTLIGDREQCRVSLDGVSVFLRLLLPPGRPL